MTRSTAIIGIVALLNAGCAPSSPNLPDVLLITWDTVRADHVGEEWTPTWNRIAKRAVVFPDARTPVPITLPAHATLMTGELPPIHGARDNGTWPVNGGLPTLAEQFQSAGWTTGAFVSASVLDSRYGIARGFSTFDDHIRPGKDRVVAHRPGTETVGNAIDWLMDKPPEKPVFLWVHLFDPHRPWETSTKAGITDYQAAIQKADDATSKLLDVMEARGRLESSIITITSDHGEALGDHGLMYKGCRFYEGLVRIPLIISWPGRFVADHQSDALVELLDLSATLLDLADVELPDYFQGASLRSILEGRDLSDAHRNFVRSEYFDALDPHFTGGSGTYATMHRTRTHKLCVYHGKGVGELFDLENDPWEHENLWEDPAHADLKHRLLAESFDAHVLLTTDVGSERIAPM